MPQQSLETMFPDRLWPPEMSRSCCKHIPYAVRRHHRFLVALYKLWYFIEIYSIMLSRLTEKLEQLIFSKSLYLKYSISNQIKSCLVRTKIRSKAFKHMTNQALNPFLNTVATEKNHQIFSYLSFRK